jgi:hypothetical protein
VCALVAAALLSLVAAPAVAAGERVAILPIKGEGMLLDDLGPIEDAMRRAIEDSGQWRVLSRHHTTRELSSARELGLHCSRQQLGCLVRFGLVAEIDLLLVPRASEEGRFFVVGASLIDVREEREVARLVRVFDRRGALESVARLTIDLLQTDPTTGAVVLTVEPEGAVIELDGQERGFSPLRSPIVGLSQGAHQLSVRKQGFRTVNATIDVRPRAVTGYQVRLSEQRAGPVRRSVAPPLDAVDADAAQQGEPFDLAYVGAVAAAGVGGSIALGAGLGALALSGGLADTGASEAERQQTALATRTLLVASSAGALIAVGAAAYLGVSLLE